MRILLAAICGFVLDLILGDPELLTPVHPVVLMGHCITALETWLRTLMPKSPRGERLGGILLAMILPLGTLVSCGLMLMLLNRLWPPLAFLLECIWSWQALAGKNLKDEAMRVTLAMKDGTTEDARAAVSRIVGRDTEALDRSGVTRAAVETVAENFSDGVAAPMLYMFLGGAPLALCYKAVNTMDSMVGYRNERYLRFGRAAARLDDAANYLPSRLAALILIAAAGICGEDRKAAAEIWKRDRRKHASPNSGQCEAVMAGALGLRLCGPASYFGKTVDKPYIGDARREAEAEDICRACRMEQTGSWLCLVLLGVIRLGIVLLGKVL
ncbi:MAG: cobalamin biosynthesis protein CobD [Oscillospiraceae bacterium]|nr:cobalamin biosynthesis protein CobD [Oscillospiraceae bacterium]